MEKTTKKLNLNVLKVGIGTNDKPSISNDKFLLRTGELARDYDDTIFLWKDHYKAIFGETRGTSSASKKLLSVVKITYTDKNNKKRSIHRAYRTDKCMNSKTIGITYNSLRLLADDIEDIIVVEVSKGCCMSYFWNHPFHATRISTRLGVISIALSIISILMSLCQCDGTKLKCIKEIIKFICDLL